MRKTFQLWLLVFVCIAFVVTLSLSFLIQTQQSIVHSETLIRERLMDACEQIQSNNANLSAVIADNHREAITKVKIFAEFLNMDFSRAADPQWMAQMEALINVDEIDVIDRTGKIIYSSKPEVVGYDMAASEQSAIFLDLVDKPGEHIVQDPQARGYGDGIDMEYAGLGLENGRGVAQIGFYSERLLTSMELADIENLSPSLRIGSEGEIAVMEGDRIVSAGDRSYIGKTLTELNLDASKLSDGRSHFVRLNGSRRLCVGMKYEKYLLVGMIPESELYTTRAQTSGFLVISNLIVFLTVFVLISWLVQRIVINGIYRVNESMQKITSGDLNERVDVTINPEFRMLSSGINATVDSLKDAIAETAARIDAELMFARSIQFSSVPSVFPPYPEHKEFDIFATMDSAKEVGGDFYDFYLRDNRYLGFVIADVSGKGIGAALYMMRVKTQIKNKMLAGGDMDEIMFDVNNDLCADNEAGMFVTAFVGMCDLVAAKLSYVNAGHNPPLICHPNGRFQYMAGKRGFVLGGMENSKYVINTQPLFAGDKLFLYTDGLTEAVNMDMELYGEKRLLDYLNAERLHDADMKTLLTTTRSQLNEFVGEAEQADDITMLGIMIRSVSVMDNKHRLQLPADKDRLNQVLEFVENALSEYDLPQKTMTHIDIALDELFTNVASYAYGGNPGEATIECTVTDGVMRLCIIDCGVPYNPLQKPDPDITQSVEDRPIGGLGIFLAKKLMDDMSYEYMNGLNQTCLFKKL